MSGVTRLSGVGVGVSILIGVPLVAHSALAEEYHLRVAHLLESSHQHVASVARPEPGADAPLDGILPALGRGSMPTGSSVACGMSGVGPQITRPFAAGFTR